MSTTKFKCLIYVDLPFFLGRLLGYEGLEVINLEGETEVAEVEAQRSRWKQEVRYDFVYLSTISSRSSYIKFPLLLFK